MYPPGNGKKLSLNEGIEDGREKPREGKKKLSLNEGIEDGREKPRKGKKKN